jgi:hypothetical protein
MMSGRVWQLNGNDGDRKLHGSTKGKSLGLVGIKRCSQKLLLIERILVDGPK